VIDANQLSKCAFAEVPAHFLSTAHHRLSAPMLGQKLRGRRVEYGPEMVGDTITVQSEQWGDWYVRVCASIYLSPSYRNCFVVTLSHHTERKGCVRIDSDPRNCPCNPTRMLSLLRIVRALIVHVAAQLRGVGCDLRRCLSSCHYFHTFGIHPTKCSPKPSQAAVHSQPILPKRTWEHRMLTARSS
jgi:hypothetical protein